MIDARQFGRGELVRWLACGALVAVAHVASALALVQWRDTTEPFETSGAIAIELAAAPTSAPETEPVVAPGPRQFRADAAPPEIERVVKTEADETPPNRPEIEKPAERHMDLPAMPNPEAVLAAAPLSLPTPPEPPKNEATAPPAPETSAPQVTAIASAAQAATPVQSVPSSRHSSALPQWTSRISILLERTKRYPKSAQAGHKEGVAVVSFVLDRQGRLISSVITTSSGVPVLDQEALDLLVRAQPFPPLPAEVTEPQLTVSVPIRFALR